MHHHVGDLSSSAMYLHLLFPSWLSPLPAHVARFHMQTGLRPANIPKATTTAHGDPSPSPGLPQEWLVSGGAEQPCLVLLTTRARRGREGEPGGRDALLKQHPNRSLESQIPGFLDNFLEQ